MGVFNGAHDELSFGLRVIGDDDNHDCRYDELTGEARLYYVEPAESP
jgi:hypothetical protein